MAHFFARESELSRVDHERKESIERETAAYKPSMGTTLARHSLVTSLKVGRILIELVEG